MGKFSWGKTLTGAAVGGALLGPLGAQIGGGAGATGLLGGLYDENSMNVPGFSSLGSLAFRQQEELLKQFQEVSNAVSSSDIASTRKDLFAQLKEIGTQGFIPTQADEVSAARLFRPRQEALRQAFEQQGQESSALASRLGRSINDPILQSRMRQEQTRQSNMMAAEQQAAALGIREQRLGALQQAGNLGLEDRFRQSQLNQDILGQEYNFRIGTSSQSTKPGLLSTLGAISGIAANFGTAASGFSGMGGGGAARPSSASSSGTYGMNGSNQQGYGGLNRMSGV